MALTLKEIAELVGGSIEGDSSILILGIGALDSANSSQISYAVNKKTNNSNSNEIELSKLKDLEESFEKETEFWQKSMNSNKIKLLNKIESLINSSINDYAIEEGYDLILYKDVVFVSDKVNITQQIIEKIEKQ